MYLRRDAKISKNAFFHVNLIFVPPELQCWHWHSPPEFHEVWHWTWSSFRRIWTRIWHGSPNEQLRTRSYAKHMAHGFTWHIIERLQGGGFGGFNDDFFRGGFSLDPQIQILWIFIQNGLLMPSIRKTLHRRECFRWRNFLLQFLQLKHRRRWRPVVSLDNCQKEPKWNIHTPP